MILVTGGTGYIGSHAVIELLEKGYEILIIDNLSNSSEKVLKKIENISNKSVFFEKIDLLDTLALKELFKKYNIQAVMHFAGLKSVEESTKDPLNYYLNNVVGTINLCKEMSLNNVKKLIFSSSATVYGTSNQVPFSEDTETSVTNPYGRTKKIIEEILQDLYASDNEWKISILRYFNPIGAHPSGKIGESPLGAPNNLMPIITQVAIGERKLLKIFGNQYNTVDGTGVRDYIHVVDLVKGHIKALDFLEKKDGFSIFNLGTGKGYSVLELANKFEKVTNLKVPYTITAPRLGDIAVCYADTSKAKTELNWNAEKDLEDMCIDAWRWQNMNPYGIK
ncbi:UDP-glucose 4-epimerase GalE [Planococcus rifietoensis]|uniref:UDP-glucose 4-epimerase GalE n=1 Tax=Planococcus rifietoensis TaxID=200991 RepID=UPI00384E5186